MPVISLNRERFCSLIGRRINIENMAKWLPWLGVDIEKVEPDFVKIEFSPNRVDFSSYAGVARAFRGLMEWEMGLPKYQVAEGEILLNVDPKVVKVRPYVVAAVVRNVKLDEESLQELMDMQEDLHWGVGRNRKKASIGVHDLDKVQPPFLYTAEDPDAVKFVPLGKAEEMSLREILEKHEKGIAYRNIVDWASRYPLLVDLKGRVLSMPPIINGELTRVKSQTQNLFIDITGTDQNAITRALNVLVTALADMGGTIESVHVKYTDQAVVSPNLVPQQMNLRISYAGKLLGLKLSEAKVIRCLRKCRLDAKRVGKGILEVLIPPFRIDIMHEVDLVEEVAIGYGYYKLRPTKPATVTTGKQHRASVVANDVRKIMIGLGFEETMNFILTNDIIHFQNMRKRAREVVRLANPVSMEYSITREKLMPGLIKNLMDNKHESYPQLLFEVSDVIKISEKSETRTERRLHVAGVSSHLAANFTEIKSYVEALLSNLGLKHGEIKETKDPSFIEGRVAVFQVKRKKIGIFGELHPEVLNNFELENPTSAFEVDLEEIF